jgi:uncharacterized protein YjdB
MTNLRVLGFSASVLLLAPGVCRAQKPVAEVQVAPAAVTITVGATHKLSALAYDAGGNVIATGVRYTWSSNNVNVARVDSTGTVTAVSAGSAVIRAEAVGSGTPAKHGAAAITVKHRT